MTSRAPKSRAGIRGAGFAIAVVLALACAPLFAQQSGEGPSEKTKDEPAVRSPGEVSNIVEELSQKIYSPYCPGKTLAMCPSGGAADVRRNIQEMARRGVPKEEIEERILAKHGEEFELKEPPKEDNYPLIGLIVLGLLVCATAVYLFAASDDEDDDAEGGSDSDDWSDREEIYLDELRSNYQQ